MRFYCRGERLFAREWISVQALRDDSVAHCGMKQYVFVYRILTLHVILTKLLARISVPRGVSEVSSHCHPELVSGSGFDPLGARRTADGQRYIHSEQRF